jgi:hypothetical protein
MPKEILRLGAFTGGLNTEADPTLIADNELASCVNFELDIDGSLLNRPAIQTMVNGAVNNRILLIGSVVLGGTLYLFSTFGGKTYVSSNNGSTWTELAPGGVSRECRTMAIFNNNTPVPAVWFPTTPTSSVTGGMSWTPAGGAVAVAAMPKGDKCVVHKYRLYIVPGPTATTNSSLLSWSGPSDFTSWPVSNIAQIRQGDGDTLNNLAVYQDNLLLFKGESTHLLAYDLDPMDAITREINPVVGSTGTFGVAQYENTLYCMHRNKIYEVNNYTFSLLNLKVPLPFDSTLPTGTTTRYEPQHVGLIGERLLVRYYNKTYSFQIRTRTWSEWRKTDTTSSIEWHMFGPLVRTRDITGTGFDSYYAGYSFDVSSGGWKIFRIVDGKVSWAAEGDGSTNSFTCTATTKNYDIATTINYKRLFWWGADVLTPLSVTGYVTPITVINTVTWDTLGASTWGDLETWGLPIRIIPPFIENVPADDIINTSKTIKFGRSFRFRKVNFSINLITNGTPVQPAKLFQFFIIVAKKQTVSARTS